MAKHQRKVQQALSARQADYNELSARITYAGSYHKPGSQNRKRSGYGKRSSNR